MERYEKPELKFVALRNEENVAATCWGYHGTDTRLYCDLEGEGWASFQIDKGPCDLNLINVLYHTDTNDNGTELKEGETKYTELYNKLLNSGGDKGNNYADEGITVIPDAPKPEWS